MEGIVNIVSLLEQIDRGEIVMPAIQRDFVWSEKQIEKLLDSIMRGYPIGIVFLWETYNDIMYRNFVRDYIPGTLHSFRENNGDRPRRLRLLLDGQQRLQSLYIALYGTYKGKELYLDVLSGGREDDLAENENRFIFKFFAPEEAERRNALGQSKGEATSQGVSRDEGGGQAPGYWCRVGELLLMSAWDRGRLASEIVRSMGLSGEDELRIGVNFSTLRDALLYDRSILKVTTIDENKPSDSRERKREADVLEAFVRMNRGGTPLSRTDLFFSVVKLGWRESAEIFPGFLDRVNDGNFFSLDTDFLLKSLFAVSGLGAKFDPGLLKKGNNM